MRKTRDGSGLEIELAVSFDNADFRWVFYLNFSGAGFWVRFYCAESRMGAGVDFVGLEFCSIEFVFYANKDL